MATRNYPDLTLSQLRAKLTQVQEILSSGVVSMAGNGHTSQIDVFSLRLEERRLKADLALLAPELYAAPVRRTLPQYL